jgi:RHS repeat-associated protein
MASSSTSARAALADGEIYSQAGNFTSAVSAGVDARTGAYGLGISLPALETNYLAGPRLTVALAFDALSSLTEEGVGLGWRLSLTRLDLDQNQLSLGNGEGYIVDRQHSNFTRGGLLAFKDLKLKTILVRQMDDFGRQFRVEHKCGDHEWLEKAAGSNVAVIRMLRTPQGFSARYDWGFTNGRYKLQRISDESRTVVEVQYTSNTVTFITWPDSATPARYVLTLLNGVVKRYTLPEGQAQWTFEYEKLELDMLFPKKVTGPLGSIDTVTYDHGRYGHQLPPGAPIANVPRVKSCVHRPGAGQPEVRSTWAWSGDNNHLGGSTPSSGGWQPGVDNLYNHRAYTYGCVETLHSDPPVTRTYRWNRFHLQTRLEEECAGKRVEHITEYGDDPDAGWSEQPAICQMPKVQIKRLSDDTDTCEERTETSYDDYGNVLETHYPDGRIVRWTYYPADESGFVRRRESETRLPAEPALGAHVTRAQFTYGQLPLRQPEDTPHPALLKHVTQLLVDSSVTTLCEVEELWDMDISSAFFGMPVTHTVTRNGLQCVTRWERSLQEGNVNFIETIDGGAQARISSSTLRDGHTGSLLLEIARSGTQTAYRYDLLGRVVERTDGANSAYAVAHLFECKISVQQTPDVHVDYTTFDGQVRRTWLDGDGREVRIERKVEDVTGAGFREIWACTYDIRGTVLTERTQDWLPGSDVPVTSTITRTYDGWGQEATIRNADQTTTVSQNDPVRRTLTQWRLSSQQEEGARTTVTKHISGAVAHVVLQAPDGTVQRDESWTIDGLGRPSGHTVTADGTVSHSITQYDPYSRVSRHTRPDQSIVAWEYAPFSDDDQAASVSLTDPEGQTQQLATRTYDLLGRPTLADCFGQVNRQSYTSGSWPTSSSTDAAGVSTAYTYDPNLDDALVEATRSGSQSNHFTYAAPQGRLTEISGERGVIKQQYSSSGRLVSSRWTDGAKDYKVQGSTSLQGRPVTLELPDATVQTRGYDAIGRPATLISGTGDAKVEVHLAHDAHGRIALIETSGHAGLKLDQAITYDSFDREATRTWTATSAGNSTQVQQCYEWTGRDQVASKQLFRNGVLLSHETYRYDVLGRLVGFESDGPQSPIDPRTRQSIRRQEFVFNALGGHTTVLTVYASGDTNVMTYTYDARVLDRPVGISHRGVDDGDIELIWDDAGRLIQEKHNGVLTRSLQWDSRGSLVQLDNLAHCIQWGYDPVGRQVLQRIDSVDEYRVYNAQSLAAVERANEALLVMVGKPSQLFAQTRFSTSLRKATLTGTDAQGSVVIEADEATSLRHYGPYGTDDSKGIATIGYVGEKSDPASGLIHLGNYRPYCPLLMMFLAPDDASPFGNGGLNRYAYCAGDPINHADPTGQSFWKWLGVVVGWIAAAAAVVSLTVITAGLAAPIIGGVAAGGASALSVTVSAAVATGSALFEGGVAAGLGTITSAALEAISIGTAIAEPILQTEGKTKAASILGWISLGVGISTGVLSVANTVATSEKLAARVASWGKFVGKWQNSLRNAGGISQVASRWAAAQTFVEDALTVARRGLTRGTEVATGNDMLVRQVLDESLSQLSTEAPLTTFSRNLQGVNRNFLSHGDASLSWEHTQAYFHLAEQTQQGTINSVTAHFRAAMLWTRVGGGQGLVGVTFNSIGGFFAGALEHTARVTGRL